MKEEFNFAFKVFLASIIPREGGKDTISVPHKHFLWFLHKRVKINLTSLLFEHLCSSIVENQTKAVATLHHPRLISEIIRQTKLIEILRQKEKLRVFQTAKFDATILVNMKKIKKEDLIKPENPLKTIYETYFWCDGFPTISEHDNEDVIKNFLEMVRRETGVRVDRSMVVNVPDWDIFKGPKDITRSRKKPRLVEQALLEDTEESNNEGQDDQSENNSAADDTAAIDERVSEEQVVRIAKRKAVEKERRTKKRNERPAATEEDQPVKAPKRIKTVVSRQRKTAGSSKGNVSEPNPVSNTEAQTSPIDYTKPLKVILPCSPSSSSSSEGTPSDYSTDTAELLRKSAKNLNKIQKKTPLKKAPLKRTPMKKTPKKTTNIPLKEVVVIDTSILDHLTSHLSGDVFTHSNLDSPNHPINKFVNTTTEPPQQPSVQEPPIIIVQTPPPNFVVSEQENPPTSKPAIQDEIMTHSEPHISSPKPSEQPPQHLPKHTTDEPAQTTAEQEPHIPSESTPAENQNIQTCNSPLFQGQKSQ
ncbi:NADH:ubiquinone reductase (H(+)-translocating) [Trifolium repens]|nr:NADH:ubiquinone reductase (H(+)-translocating) [Trifolium repens]